MRSFRSLAIALLMILAAVSVALAQANAKVTGTVTDPNGAAVPGAVVKLLNQATKIEVETTTNESGYFNLANVNPSMYSLRVEVPGFKGIHSAPFSVGVNEAVVQDITLTVGAVSETVEITAGAELIQQASSDLGTVIPEKVVQDLPLNGRNFTQLLTLTPGVTPVSTSQNRNVGGVEGNVVFPVPVLPIRRFMDNQIARNSISSTASSTPTFVDRRTSLYPILIWFRSL